jgi:hypothetical protein
MTEERLALAQLLEKAGEGDFLRAVAEAVLQLLMEADVERVIGAGRYERSGEGARISHSGWGLRGQLRRLHAEIAAITGRNLCESCGTQWWCSDCGVEYGRWGSCFVSALRH